MNGETRMDSSGRELDPAALHRDALVITSHDHLWDYEDLVQTAQGGIDAKVLMLHVDALPWDDEGPDSSLHSIYDYEGWARRALTRIENALAIIDTEPERFLLVRTAGDVLEAQRSGRTGIIFGFEGARPLEGSLSLLRIYHRLGLRHLQLTWAYGNQVCDRVAPPPGELGWTNYRGTRTTGLTDFGRAVVREANRLGIILDPSHASAQTYDELYDLSTHPIIISHATCREAGKNAGDVTDHQLRRLAQNGGVLCLHFFAHYLRDQNASIDDLVDHILHAIEVAGIDHVGLGADWLHLNAQFLRIHDKFAGLPPDHVRPADKPLGPIEELSDPTKLPRLTERLVQREFAAEEITKILGGNLLRVYRQVWGD
jgi:membrane dipeptidase